MNRFLHFFVFAVGLAAACWVGAGYVASNPLALAVTALIVVVYLAGALELYRYQQATSTLTRALEGLSEPPASLGEWLSALHPGLRVAVRQRVEGERVGLPGPVLAPYLVGLLVLLGMLGTFLGMIATLRGTGLALESATDLHAIRASLAAPVKGLGFAFGTSVAGVATSAMLGLLSALCRRERIGAAHRLDAKIATTLRVYSQIHQREEGFRLLQRQAEGMAVVADRLQAMMAAMERHNLALNEGQAARQSDFHAKAEAAYARLAGSVEQSLKESVAEGVRAAGTAIQPVVESTMAGLAQGAAALHDTVNQAVRQQLEGLSARFEASTATAADVWNGAAAAHQRASESLTQDLRLSLDGFVQTFEQRSASLLDSVSTHLDGTASTMSQAWDKALSRHEHASGKLADDNQRALTAAVSAFEQHSAALVSTVGRSHGELRAELASQDAQRLAAWTGTLAETAALLRKEWEEAGAQAANRQREICEALAQTASDISSQTTTQAGDTVAEIARLLQAAGEAPKAAAALVAEVRQAFSDSMARDNAMLEERNRLLETLGTLLAAVNHASSEQRGAVDALLAGSADVLDRVGAQFTAKVEAETGKLAGVAAQVTSSAVEVASLGDAFGAAVQLFGQSNASLMEHLQRIEAALDKSVARSDEQLAYYVAQAKEVIDLSMMSQKQIIEELQQMADQRASTGPVSP
ncbi:DUF802 domain-containing protein [Pollutimonas bauzanensis]|uniref:DUF802 domain-containing protein n=1 Tax=Pollutimonas bauzanensis TaxID=658167 RepID=A0A1M5ZSY9_9BURK|nr:DUF802 domain-containing protein [Pollutimonas bauzanensis]SHI27331.1 protein of unknown function [Pollutimonas bauzanensis]